MAAIIILDCLVVAVACIWLFELIQGRRIGKLPPGPRRYPVIGSALDMPRSNVSQGFAKLSKKYGMAQYYAVDKPFIDVLYRALLGDAIYLKVFNQGFLILNSKKAAAKALNVRGKNSAGRPFLVMASELSGYDRFLGCMQNSKKLQEGKTYLNSVISPYHAQKYADAQQSAALRFLRKLAKNPNDFERHCKWIVGSCILLISHGYSAEDEDDPLIAASSTVINQFADAAQPSKWLVDTFPFLKHIPNRFPGAAFKHLAAMYRSNAEAVYKNLFVMVKEQLESGTAKPSLVASFIGDHENMSKAQQEFIMFIMGDLFGAGIETMTSAVTSFFLAMAKNLAVQQRAQAEIDAFLLGEHRLPTFNDKSKLPYVEALVIEVMRWGAITPLGLPHRYTARDTFDGYDIPENTIAFANIAAISYDPRTYPDPESFSPERFLGPNPQEDPRKNVFGYGGRLCPGGGLAEQILFIIMSSTLTVFDIHPRKGASYVVSRTDSLISSSIPFICDIHLRSEEHKDLIAQR